MSWLARFLWIVVPPIGYVALLRLTAPQGVDPSGRATLFGLQLMIWACFGVPVLLIVFSFLAFRGLLPGTSRPDGLPHTPKGEA